MTKIKVQSHSDVLEEIVKELDIPDATYEKAVGRYEAVGDWLERDESTIGKYTPEIYPQGSFQLGTVIKPYAKDDEYDIDIVCELAINKTEIVQKQLKEIIGKELRGYTQANSLPAPVEKRRCWTLNYRNVGAFHMDILPAIPNTEKENGGILITDEELSSWLHSNPKGYIAWFRERMDVPFQNMRRARAEATQARVDEILEHTIKTPLQRVIQLLKRHRDVMFSEKPDHQPISIIITTLAAHAYNNENNIAEAMINILSEMDKFIEKRGSVCWISNPVDEQENFADKWAEEPEKRKAFYEWLDAVRRDFGAYINASPYKNIPDRLKNSLDKDFIKTIIASLVFEAANTTQSFASPSGNTNDRTEAMREGIENTGTSTQPWYDGK